MHVLGWSKKKHLTSDCACKFSRFSMGLEKKKKKRRERETKESVKCRKCHCLLTLPVFFHYLIIIIDII